MTIDPTDGVPPHRSPSVRLPCHAMADMYGSDVLSGTARRRRPQVPVVDAERDLVVEDAESGFCGAVVGFDRSYDGEFVKLEDRHGRVRLFAMTPSAFLIDGSPVTLRKPAPAAKGPTVTASGSRKVEGLRARTARAGRIWVEGIHDAALVEKIWGHDLRVEGIVVEPLHGIDDLPGLVAEFGPTPSARLGVLVDHLVKGSKESRIVAGLGGDVLVTGHPYVDIWQAVKPEAVGIREWPVVPRGEDWKTGICMRLGWGEPADGFRHVLSSVSSYRDIEPTLLGAVERLVDFVTEPA